LRTYVRKRLVCMLPKAASVPLPCVLWQSMVC
jgi:hypothetical protein